MMKLLPFWLLLASHIVPSLAGPHCRGHHVPINPNETIGVIPNDISLCPGDVYPDLNVTFVCTQTAATPSLANLAHCGTSNNQDYYGFGVRVGFYFTWGGTWIAYTFVPEEAAGAIDANTIFLFALAISGLKATFDEHSFYRVDAVVLLLIAAGTAVGTMSLWGYRTCLHRLKGGNAFNQFGGFGTYSRTLLCFVANLYWLWFWYNPSKRDLSVANCDPRCFYVWVFGRSISSHIRWLFWSFGLVYQIWLGVMIPGVLVTSFTVARKIVSKSEDTELRYTTGLSPPQLRRASFVLPILNAIWFIFIIALIEKTLHQNSSLAVLQTSQQATSAAQLIPLLVGVATFARTSYYAAGMLLRKLGDHAADNENKSRVRKSSRVLFRQVPKSDDSENETSAENSEAVVRAKVWKRILVTWMPWLGLIRWFELSCSAHDELVTYQAGGKG